MSITENMIEKLARAIHENYVKEQTKKNAAAATNAIPWEKLTEEFRESNRNVARSIKDKLAFVGMVMKCEADTPAGTAIDSFDEATTFLLARYEHIRWMDEKLANGWTYAPVRDNAQKHHPMLIPYEQLPQEEQQKDIDIVNNIIPLLKSVGVRVCRK